MSDFKRAAKNVQQFKNRLESETERGLHNGMDDVASSLRRHLGTSGPMASGFLAQSIHQEPAAPSSGNSYAKSMILGADYWRYLEFGTGIYSSRGYKAASPAAPIGPIYRWVLAAEIHPDPDEPYDTQFEVARAIAHSVSSGTKQHKFVRPVWRGVRGRRRVVKKVADGGNRALHRSF